MKLFWKKFSAVALIGAMLSNVGCTYKADIEELNRQVEALKGTVALKADVQKIQTTVDQIAGVDFSQFLKTADFAAQLKASGVAYSSDLKAWLTSDEVKALIEGYKYQTAEDVKKLIEGLQSKEDVEAVFDAMIKAYDIWGAVSGDVAAAIADAMKNAEFMTGESKLSDAQVNQVMSEIAKAFGAEGADVKAAIDGWLGENFAKYMEAYEPTEAFIAKLGIGTSAVSAILDEVKDANSEFTAEINRLIAEATNGKISEATLESKLSAYNTRLTAVEVKVAEIEGRIQSIVWVPQTLSEVQNNYVMLDARNTITVTNPKAAKKDQEKVVVLGNSEKTVVWEVTPKSVLANISEENIKVYSNDVVTKADHKTWENVSAVEIDPEEGTVAVTISAADQQNNKYGEIKPMIALHVSVPSAVEGGKGIDYTSDYILVLQSPETKYKATDFTFFKENEKATAFGDTHKISILYTETGTFEFLKDASVVVNDGTGEKPAYSTIDKKWAAFGNNFEIVWTPVKKDGKEVVAVSSLGDGAKGLLDLTVKGFTVKKSDSNLIGSTVTSGDFNYMIAGKKGTEYEGYSLDLGNIKVEYTFDKEETKAKVSAAEFLWKYEQTEYVSEALTVSGLKVKEYDEIFKPATKSKLMDYSGEKPVEVKGVTLTLEKEGQPVKDTDPMYVNLNIKDESGVAFVKDGEYTAEFAVEIDNSYVTLNVPVKVKGAPTLKAPAAYTETFTYIGLPDYELVSAKNNFKKQLVDLNKDLWDAKGIGKQIDKVDFEAMVDAGEPKTEKDGKATLSTSADGKVLSVNFDVNDKDFVYGKVYTPYIEYGIKGFGFKVETKVSLVKPAVKLVANPALVGDKGALVKSNIDLVTGKFDVEKKDFVNVFDATINGKVNNTDYVVSYFVVKEYEKDKDGNFIKDKDGNKIPADDQTEALDELKGDAPDFVGNILYWKEWAQKELKLMAKATLAKAPEVVVATEIFTAYINDPVVKDIEVIKESVDSKTKIVNWNSDIYAGEDAADLTRYFKLETSSAIAGTTKKVDVIATDDDAVVANGAIDGEFKFDFVGDANSLVKLDKKNYKIYVEATPVEITKEFNITVKVTYTHKFMAKDEARTANITFTVKPGTRPDPEKK